MALTRIQKQKIIEDLKEKMEKQKIMVFVDFKGLKVGDLFDLRNKLKKVDSQLKISKKTLLNLALKEKGMKIDAKKLEGEVAVVFGFEDAISPAKIAYQFSLENSNLKILGGYFDGKYREAQEIIILAQLPTRDDLLAQLLRSISAPILNLISVLEGNFKGLIYVLNKIKT